MPAVYSFYTPSDAKIWPDLEFAVDSLEVGGFITFRGDVLEQQNIARRLQKKSRLPLLFAADYENGTGSIYNHGTHFVTAMGIAATGDAHSAFLMGKITAMEARALGVHMIFAPVADVNSNPDNLIINYRAFGDTPETVTPFILNFIKGIQENGAIAVAKHFPGHGDVSQDSHLQLVVQNKPLEEWTQEELPPFDAAINSGVGGIMTAHIAFPALADSITPATLSKEILSGVLRKKLNFEGLLITDALNMGGIRNQYWTGAAALKAFNAGADILLMPKNLRATAEFLLQAYLNGDISEQRLEYSVKKILESKKKLKLWTNPGPDEKIWESVGLKKNIAIADSISSKALTLLKQDDFNLPLNANEKTVGIVFSDENSGPGALGSFVSQFSYFSNLNNFFAVDKRSTDDEYDEIDDAMDEADRIILALKVPIKAFSGTATLDEKQMEYLHDILDDYPKSLVIVFGNPYFLKEIPEAKNTMLAYTYSKMMQKVTARAIFGKYAISGQLPVNIPGIAIKGKSITVPAIPTGLNDAQQDMPEIDQIIAKAIADTVFPGCQVAIGKNGKLLKDQSYGFRTYQKNHLISGDNQYDLASLTKVLATTLSLMKLYDNGELSLDYPLKQFYPHLPEDKGDITIKQLLTHTSGFAKWIRFFERTDDPDSILTIIFNDSLAYKPGEKQVYSDLNFIILKHIVDFISGEPMETYVNRNFYIPLGLKQTRFNPPDTNNCVPTEILNGYRVQGVVQDRNARMLGGISGHAGLFSNASDIAVIAQMILNGGIYNNKRYLKKGTIDLFSHRQFDREGWTHALGWDTPSREGSLVGEEFPRETIGHWGYSGTSVWIDFENNIFVILLSNRTWPDRNNKKINKWFRPQFHDLVFETLKVLE